MRLDCIELDYIILGFAPIFQFHCEHVLFVYIVKQKQTNKFADLIKIISRIFKIFKNKILMEANFLKIRSSINFPWGLARSQNKFGHDRFSRFDLYWIQTNRQTDGQTSKQTNTQIIYDLGLNNI